VTRRGESPFLRYGLDPTADLATITERLRELAEDATDPAERDAIRSAWEALTKSPMVRFELALEVSPGPPALPGLASLPREEEPAFAPRLADLLTPGPVLPRLGPMTAEEARTLRVDLSFLLREDEARATGPIGEASPPSETDRGMKKR
jgi:hypothetical protein